MPTASGTFDVKMIPQQNPDGISDPAIGRFALDKRFHGPIDATSRGEMIAHRTALPTSAAYVAMERIVGTLDGRRGSWVMHHVGIATAAGQTLNCAVVPDSGTDELVGLAGTLRIIVANGEHRYEFDYTLPDT